MIDIQHWDGYDSIEKELRFEGLSLRVITFTNDPERYSLSSADIEDARWQIAAVRVGSATREVLLRLGVEFEHVRGEWRFAGETETLVIVSDDEKILRVRYECYTG